MEDKERVDEGKNAEYMVPYLANGYGLYYYKNEITLGQKISDIQTTLLRLEVKAD